MSVDVFIVDRWGNIWPECDEPACDVDAECCDPDGFTTYGSPSKDDTECLIDALEVAYPNVGWRPDKPVTASEVSMGDMVREEQIKNFDTNQCEQEILKSLLLEIQGETDPERQRIRSNTYYDMLIAVEYRHGMSK